MMDMLERIRSEFDVSFRFDTYGEIETNEHQIKAVKKFMHRWGWMMQLVIGVDESLTNHRFTDETGRPQNRAEMIRLHGLSYVLKQRFEQLREPFIPQQQGVQHK